MHRVCILVLYIFHLYLQLLAAVIKVQTYQRDLFLKQDQQITTQIIHTHTHIYIYIYIYIYTHTHLR